MIMNSPGVRAPEFARHRDIWTRCLTSKKLVDMVGGMADAGGRGDGRADLDRSQYGMPALMRSARGVYAQAIRAQLQLIGIDELPANGAFILAGIDASGGPRHDLPAELGVTKQAVNQVIDILVNRGYLTRNPDSGDRRRVVLELTDRGQEAVDAVRCGIEAVDRLLAERVSAEQVDAMRSALIALTEIKGTAVGTGAGRRPPARQPRQLLRLCPIFPVRDLGAALAHYASLGFETVAHHDGGGQYGFATRDGVQLHLATVGGTDAHPADAYLFVRDADALHEEWSRPGLAGHTYPVYPTAYKLREGSHVDPDGNVIRFGSPMPE
jgi:DNA-binding MarR family transcriptional regulator/catechol 2,3-dioxygenase-like lactoylglutathione lyase family enzyme